MTFTAAEVLKAAAGAIRRGAEDPEREDSEAMEGVLRKLATAMERDAAMMSCGTTPIRSGGPTGGQGPCAAS